MSEKMSYWNLVKTSWFDTFVGTTIGMMICLYIISYPSLIIFSLVYLINLWLNTFLCMPMINRHLFGE